MAQVPRFLWERHQPRPEARWCSMSGMKPFPQGRPPGSTTRCPPRHRSRSSCSAAAVKHDEVRSWPLSATKAWAFAAAWSGRRAERRGYVDEGPESRVGSRHIDYRGCSITRFLLMPKGQDIYRIVSRFVPVQGHIAGIAEGDHQLAQFGHFRQWSANVGGCLQQQELSLDGLAGSPGCFRCFGCQKLAAALQAFHCTFGDDYSWHSGAAPSSSAPQVFNQARTSSPVRWRPVSW